MSGMKDEVFSAFILDISAFFSQGNIYLLSHLEKCFMSVVVLDWLLLAEPEGIQGAGVEPA
ncbi:MAG: hypothetical protein VKL59_11365 [Nostocaceae cyanobacterium]|nr:hypothetical protein [Nostocaceae cyanobacterium]